MNKAMLKLTAIATAVAALSLGSFSTQAATDGTPGTSTSPSVGTMDLLVLKGAIARITGLNDLYWGNVLGGSMVIGSGANGNRRSINFCVFSSTGDYSINATSALGGGQFRMTDGVDFLPYSVTWDEIPAAGAISTLAHGTPSNFTSASVTDELCGGTNTATMIIDIDETVFNAGGISDAAYTDTLTLTIAPVP